jgi:hypothetical protein
LQARFQIVVVVCGVLAFKRRISKIQALIIYDIVFRPYDFKDKKRRFYFGRGDDFFSDIRRNSRRIDLRLCPSQSAGDMEFVVGRGTILRFTGIGTGALGAMELTDVADNKRAGNR